MKSYLWTATDFSRAVTSALIQQAFVILLSAMILDGGGTAQICLYAFAGFWGGTALLAFRRGAALSRVDIAFIRWGYIPVCVLAFALTGWIWAMRGYTDL
jgi:hypothetical protein